MMYIGTDAVYTYTFEHTKRADCPVCGGETMDVHVQPDWTLDRLIEWLVEKQDMSVIYLLFVELFVGRNSSLRQPNQETVLI
jgi:hypothetical protein